MESQPPNPEFRINPENFHPCIWTRSLSSGVASTIKLKNLEILSSGLFISYKDLSCDC